MVDMGRAKEPVTSPRRQWPMHTHPKERGEEDGVSMNVRGGWEWAVSLCSEDQATILWQAEVSTQGSGDGYAVEAPAVEKRLWRWRSGYFRAAGEVGDNQRARLRCVEKVRLRNEANKFYDWKRRAEK